MRLWKRVVAIVLIAAAALAIEGWTARAEPPAPLPEATHRF
ncbi:hypothetical protein [Kribbella speibonae]|nr:hypothetical protein [Kribbella speibonae]